MATNLLQIEDNMIRGMMADQRFLTLIPCLADTARTLQTRLAECTTCARKKNTANVDAIKAAKGCLTRLPAETRKKLKAMLDTRQIRIYKIGGQGQTIKVTY